MDTLGLIRPPRSRPDAGHAAEGFALLGVVLTLLVLGGLAAISIVAVGSLSGSTTPGGASTGRPASTHGGTAPAGSPPAGPLPAVPQHGLAAAQAAERTTLVTAESAYFALHQCYVPATGLVAAGILGQLPRYWAVTTPAGSCPGRYALVPAGGPPGG